MEFSIRSILFATDFSAFSTKALEYVIYLGSTSHKIALASPLPVLIIRSEPHQS